MRLFLRIDLNLAAIILFGSVIAIARKRLDPNDRINLVFLYTAFAILAELVLETLTCILNGYPARWLIPITASLHVLLFIIAPVIPYLWCVFVSNWDVSDEPVVFKRTLLLVIPNILNLITVLLTPFFGLVFSISGENIYERGPLFVVPTITTYFYVFYSFFLIAKKRKDLMRELLVPLTLFGVFPAIGGLIQVLFYGILLMWSSAAFSLIVVFIFIQQRMMQFDPLTGAWTKSSFERYMEERVCRQKNREPFGVIFIDLDEFKTINDRFGHCEGDYALKKAVSLIKETLRKTDIIARFGGDEFVVLVKDITRPGIEDIMNRLSENFSLYNKNSEKPYRLEYSSGYELFDSDNRDSEHFLNHVDHLMYINKKNKK